MAEFVQARMEAMIDELEQLQRVEILSPKEVQELTNRRRRYEYKIQKVEKRKEDFLEYIQYEMALLSLIELRREKLGYQHKKKDIDYMVMKRINDLYKIMEHRFQNDHKIWLSHADFLKKVKWDSSVGKIYRRMLQVHVHKLSLWILAAKYEIEEAGRAENARSILFEALRFHPKSSELYREYFRLELLYVEQLRKRAEVLGVTSNVTSADEGEVAVLKGQIAKAVFKSAIEAIPDDPELVAAMLEIAHDFEFATKNEDEKSAGNSNEESGEDEEEETLVDLISRHFEENFAGTAISWDVKARISLRSKPETETKKKGAILNRLEEACKIYEQGLKESRENSDGETGKGSVREIHEFFVEFLLDLARLSKADNNSSCWVAKRLESALRDGEKQGCLSEKNAKLLANLL